MQLAQGTRILNHAPYTTVIAMILVGHVRFTLASVMYSDRLNTCDSFPTESKDKKLKWWACYFVNIAGDSGLLLYVHSLNANCKYSRDSVETPKQQCRFQRQNNSQHSKGEMEISVVHSVLLGSSRIVERVSLMNNSTSTTASSKAAKVEAEDFEKGNYVLQNCHKNFLNIIMLFV